MNDDSNRNDNHNHQRESQVIIFIAPRYSDIIIRLDRDTVTNLISSHHHHIMWHYDDDEDLTLVPIPN